MKYELLNNLSGAVVFITVTLIFISIFEPAVPVRKYLRSLIPFLGLMFFVNSYVIFRFGFAVYGKFSPFLATIPSLIYFYLVSLHRDGRFFFTFCLVDTSAIWFALMTGLIDYALNGNGLVNFILRLVLSPVLLFLVHRFVRTRFLNVLHTVERGWWLFTALTGLVYLILILLTCVPVSLRYRPEDIPLAVVILFFLPLTYMTVFYVLFSQQKLNEMGSMHHAFEVQSSMIEEKARELRAAEDKIRIERHDLRHRLKIIEEFVLKNESEQVLDYLNAVQRDLDETAVTSYCTNPVLDAILSSYIRQAEEAGIAVCCRLDIPDELPVPAAELATVFANALENAIHTCSSLPAEKKKIICTCIRHPKLMLEIKNPIEQPVSFNPDGLPVSSSNTHGYGTKSILAFCRKYNATYHFSADDGWFKLVIGL